MAKESSLSRLLINFTNNVRFKIFLIFDKKKCHFQNYSSKVCDDILMCFQIIGNNTEFR